MRLELFLPSSSRPIFGSFALLADGLKEVILILKTEKPPTLLPFSILLPLYHCFGDSIADKFETKNKVKTGFAVAALVYLLFSATTAGLAWPLVRVMGQNETLYEETVDYIRIELVGVVFGSLSKFLLLVIVMHRWNAALYLSLVAHTLTSAGFDYGLASQRGLHWGALGIAYSSLASQTIVFLFNFAVVWFKLGFSFRGRIFRGNNVIIVHSVAFSTAYVPDYG